MLGTLLRRRASAVVDREEQRQFRPDWCDQWLENRPRLGPWGHSKFVVKAYTHWLGSARQARHA